jgi:CBS-domain-containing membrane protein
MVPEQDWATGLGIDLTDDDCYEAMRAIPGYLDISLEDFREIYRLALTHAAGRLTGGLKAGDLMEPVILTLTPDQGLGQAVRALAGMQLKGAPVVDGAGRPVGMLSETDVLRHLGVRTWLGLLVQHLDGDLGLELCCRGALVGGLMTAPAVVVTAEAGVMEVLATFRTHPGRRMPVVDPGDGHVLGILARKALLHRLGPSAEVGWASSELGP